MCFPDIARFGSRVDSWLQASKNKLIPSAVTLGHKRTLLIQTPGGVSGTMMNCHPGHPELQLSPSKRNWQRKCIIQGYSSTN